MSGKHHIRWMFHFPCWVYDCPWSLRGVGYTIWGAVGWAMLLIVLIAK